MSTGFATEKLLEHKQISSIRNQTKSNIKQQKQKQANSLDYRSSAENIHVSVRVNIVLSGRVSSIYRVKYCTRKNKLVAFCP